MKEAAPSVMLDSLRESNVPFWANFELTYRCNLKCVHCYQEEDTSAELSTAEVFSIIDQLADAGTLHVNLIGGEALLRDDFFDIAGYARRKNMAVLLYSNGTLIDEKAVKAIKRLHFAYVAISLYGSTPEVHERVTRGAGSFNRTVRAIRLLRQEGIEVRVNAMVMKQNLKEIERLNDFCAETGGKLGPEPHITAATSGSMRPLQYRLNDADLQEYVRWETVNGMNEKATRIGPCNAGRSMVCISARGEVFPCVMLRRKAGDLRKETFRQIWTSSPLLYWLRGLSSDDFQSCHECELRTVCVDCPGQALYEEGSILLPSRESCRITRIREEARNERERRSAKVQEKI